MKGRLDLQLKQSLLMTSEMRLAIDMLAMSSSEIDQLLDEELKNNPCLEEDEHYSTDGYNPRWSSDQEQSVFLASLRQNTRDEDFREGLLRQVGEGRFNSIETDIALMIINNLNDDGLLDDIENVFAFIVEHLHVFDEWIESVRLRIMELDPPGCGAKNVNETLLFQAQRKCFFAHQEFLAMLADLKDNPSQKINQGWLHKIKNDEGLIELKLLRPRPSAPHQIQHNENIILPDISVSMGDRGPLVSLLKNPSSRIFINKRYRIAKQLKEALLKASHKRATFLLRSLKFRENSVLAVAKLVVDAQADWFFHDGALKALHLRDIAENARLHESSVSRIVRGKYIACDRGVFELKYFFGSAIKQQNGLEETSASFIKEKIRLAIAKENKTRPWSDQQIKQLLFSQGIIISRRTVAKYRGHLKISSAQKRRTWL